MDEYLPAALAYYTAYPSDDYTELNSLAWTFYEGTDDPAQLAQAIEWAEQSVAIRAYYPNLDTLAWLYKKVGRTKRPALPPYLPSKPLRRRNWTTVPPKKYWNSRAAVSLPQVTLTLCAFSYPLSYSSWELPLAPR